MIPLPACTIVTAPTTGRLVTHAEPDTLVEAGDVVAVLEGPEGRLVLRARSRGRVGGALQDVDDPVVAGEGVLWLAR